jgi:hypothetical protein
MQIINTFAVFAIPPASRFELDECCGGRSNLNVIAAMIEAPPDC